MGTGYTRNDTSNNIADGNIINAADFDGEYNAIEAAFNSSTGHTHDGTAAEGGAITVLGPNQEFVATSSAVNPSTNASLDLGTSSLKFKDLYIDGIAYIDGFGGDILAATDKKIQFRDTAIFINSSADGQLDIDADTTIELNSPEVIATDDFRLKSDSAILTFGADNDVTVTHVADTGLDAQAASGFVLKLQTGDTTVESGNTLGKISFNAPSEASGTDAILVGAEIEAAAEATFSSTDNSTALVFKTNTSAAATERMRIKSDGDIVFTGAAYNMTWDTSASSLDFADSAKASFGADADLQIYHDGSSSFIDDSGTGSLRIRSDSSVVIEGTDGTNGILVDTDGEVQLYFNGSSKLETTTDGIDVSGDISVGNLNLITNTISSTDTNGNINLSPNGTGTVVINTDLDVDNINIDGNTISSTDTNGDINITPNGTGKVNIAGSFVPSEINLTSTDGGTGEGPVLDLYRNSSSPSDNDLIGAIDFSGEDSGGNKTTYAKLYGKILDVTDTTEDAFFALNVFKDGSEVERMRSNATETVFNESSYDLDFRIESDGSSYMFFVDGGNDIVNIGTSSNYGAKLNILRTDNGTNLSLITTDADASTGPIFELYRNSASPNDNDFLGKMAFYGENSAGEKYEYARMYAQISDATDATEDTNLILETSVNGSIRERLGFYRTGTIINQDGQDIDLRVEGNNEDYLLFVDAGNDRVGISTSSPAEAFHVTGSMRIDGNNTGVTSGDAVNQIIFKDTDTTTGGGQPMGDIDFVSNDSGNEGVSARIRGSADSSSTATGRLTLSTGRVGTLSNNITMDTGEVVINEASADMDFRVESDNYTHALFVDGANGRVKIGAEGNVANKGALYVNAAGTPAFDYDEYATIIATATEARVQIAAADGGSHASHLLLTAGSKHVVLSHFGPTLSNKFGISHTTSTADGDNIVSAAVTSGQALEINTNNVVSFPKQPKAYMAKSGDQSVSGVSTAKMTMSANSVSNGMVFDNTNDRLTIPSYGAGEYLIQTMISGTCTTANVGDGLELVPRKNGSDIWNSDARPVFSFGTTSGEEFAMSEDFVLTLAGGDYIELWILNIATATTNFEIQRARVILTKVG